jgi:predicted ATPase
MLNNHFMTSNTVNVLIGANGSGKSRLLREISLDALGSWGHVIAVAPTIYDRFRGLSGARYKFFGARNGRGAAARIIRKALERASSEDPQVLKNLTRALHYTGFDPVIGMRVSNLKLENFESARHALSREEAEELQSSLHKWQSRTVLDYQGMVRIELNEYSFREFDALSFAIIARYESFLRKSKVLSKVEYLLFRGSEVIPLLEACSGELCFITTIAFIATNMELNSLIVIDEPETSLHPTWQKNYISTLLDLFHYYNPRIVISTHSPIIISGAEVSTSVVSVHELSNGVAKHFPHGKFSLEEMYDILFGLITPKNHHLSNVAMDLLNDLNARRKSLEEVSMRLQELREKSYDETQQMVIGRIQVMARELNNMAKSEYD